MQRQPLARFSHEPGSFADTCPRSLRQVYPVAAVLKFSQQGTRCRKRGNSGRCYAGRDWICRMAAWRVDEEPITRDGGTRRRCPAHAPLVVTVAAGLPTRRGGAEPAVRFRGAGAGNLRRSRWYRYARYLLVCSRNNRAGNGSASGRAQFQSGRSEIPMTGWAQTEMPLPHRRSRRSSRQQGEQAGARSWRRPGIEMGNADGGVCVPRPDLSTACVECWITNRAAQNPSPRQSAVGPSCRRGHCLLRRRRSAARYDDTRPRIARWQDRRSSPRHRGRP